MKKRILNSLNRLIHSGEHRDSDSHEQPGEKSPLQPPQNPLPVDRTQSGHGLSHVQVIPAGKKIDELPGAPPTEYSKENQQVDGSIASPGDADGISLYRTENNPSSFSESQPPLSDSRLGGFQGLVTEQDRPKSLVLNLDSIENHPDISVSMRALGEKYKISEITIATDDGLVLATSAKRNVEFDAIHYSHVVMLKTIPCEPDVKLFELNYNGSRLIGIIRTSRHISPAMKDQIRDDTKVILQWWL